MPVSSPTSGFDEFECSQRRQARLSLKSVFMFRTPGKSTANLRWITGLRYDYQTYMKEQYGRMQDASFSTLDKTLGPKWRGHLWSQLWP